SYIEENDNICYRNRYMRMIYWKKRSIEEEIKKSYLEYAMSVIVSRALPDVRDGLKPVQRRLLYSMNEMGFWSDKPHRKSARIVGDTMGKYHPHGDNAIYDALARMAQDFTLRYPLIDGQGNFGSIDGDAPAAMRYTEARLSKLSEDMLKDLDKETVNFRLNFDGSLQEPDFLPSMIPNLIINGASGIAVGMATNILPHNLSEICDALSLLIKNSASTVGEIMGHIKGPDFPGGGIIYFSRSSMESYETGRGKIVVRGEVELDEKKKIIIKSIPYSVNKALFLERMADQVKDEILTGITDIRDESSREGMRIVIKIRDDETKGLILNQLYAHTELEQSSGIINLVLVNNVPKVLGIKEI
ncbi:DNA gyrase, A subunit, partial [mine drainage metagenome]